MELFVDWRHSVNFAFSTTIPKMLKCAMPHGTFKMSPDLPSVGCS
uniref:TIDP3459 n=1 Tax=Arundo donax TaxID=35708 RepID=A0A0A9EJX7_ARUDO